MASVLSSGGLGPGPAPAVRVRCSGRLDAGQEVGRAGAADLSPGVQPVGMQAVIDTGHSAVGGQEQAANKVAGPGRGEALVGCGGDASAIP
jgi:hypothetical protein